MAANDQRSEEARLYRHLYNSARWKSERLIGLRLEPLCCMCQAQGKLTPATVRDHIKAHKGNTVLFWDRKNHQSLCKPHHDGAKQRIDIRGYSNEVDLDGWPIDPRHPANGGKIT